MINIKLPLPEKVSANKIYSGMHWTKRKKLADLYHQCLLPFRNIKITNFPVEVSYIFTFKSRPLDASNTFFMVKMLEDGLVKNNIFIDDTINDVSAITVMSREGSKDEVEIIIV